MAASVAELAWVRAVDAWASLSRDSVPHFADANPDQAASTATTASSMASMIETVRSWREVGSWLWACLACSASSLPTSVGSRPPSPTERPGHHEDALRAHQVVLHWRHGTT